MFYQRANRIGWITLALSVAITLVGVMTVDQPTAKEPKSEAFAGLLDGKVFVGETGRTGKDRGRSDKFIFRGGKFQASAFSAYGFSDATYESTENEGELSFSVTVISKRSSGGKMFWTGTLRDDVLEGTMRWDHGWESRAFWFRAKTKAS